MLQQPQQRRQARGSNHLVLACVMMLPVALAFLSVPSGRPGLSSSNRVQRATAPQQDSFIRRNRYGASDAAVLMFSSSPQQDEPMIGPAMPPPPSSPAAAPEVEEEEPLSAEEAARREKLAKIEALRAKEVFQTKETGDYECKVCGWQYKEVDGFGPYKPGTAFAALPESFKCPKCKADKKAFGPLTVTIAGFVDNSKYGLGGNSLTSEQKSGLIFGSLFFFFGLFLAGYLLE